jgi:glutaredoxin
VKSRAQDSEAVWKQECTVPSLYLSGLVFVIGYVIGLVFLAYRAKWVELVLWSVVLPCLKWAYLRSFPRTSKWRGYGSVDDKLPSSMKKASVQVTYYVLLGCPFCPIVEQRLKTLQDKMNFSLSKIDLTLRPQLAMSKGIRSVPVVEVGEDRVIGNATTEQLAQLIGRTQVS